jgi:hypothetical protein
MSGHLSSAVGLLLRQHSFEGNSKGGVLMSRKVLAWLVPLGIVLAAALNGEGPWPPI